MSTPASGAASGVSSSGAASEVSGSPVSVSPSGASSGAASEVSGSPVSGVSSPTLKSPSIFDCSFKASSKFRSPPGGGSSSAAEAVTLPGGAGVSSSSVSSIKFPRPSVFSPGAASLYSFFSSSHTIPSKTL